MKAPCPLLDKGESINLQGTKQSYVQDWEEAQEFGDLIIGTIKLKRVVNPLENDSIFKKSMEKGLESHPVQEKYMKNATEIIEQLSKDE